MRQQRSSQRIFVAMSGGVDSSVAAARLCDAGQAVEGVTMRLHGNPPALAAAPDQAVEAARAVARTLGIPHHVVDLSADLRELVIADFISEYVNGRTPNPCCRCNRFLKFGVLFDKVLALGADALATGHYARRVVDPASGEVRICRPADAAKDQTYFLSGVPKACLPMLRFPLGDLTKAQVRELARTYDLPAADRPESQDICFVSEGGYQDFIRQQAGEALFVPGPFVNHRGETVGQHQGLAHYTIGQRDKLGIALGYPAYVYRMDPRSNTIFVGPEDCLYADGLLAAQFNYLGPGPLREPAAVQAQIRYHAPAVPAWLTVGGAGQVRVDFDQPQKAVTPGQSVAFYQGDTLWGGAVIDRSLRNKENSPRQAA